MTDSSSPSPVGSPIVPPVFHSFEPPSIPSIASSSTLPSMLPTISPPTIPAAPIPRRLTHVSVRAALRELAKEQPKSFNDDPLSFHSSSDDEDAEEEEHDQLDDYDDDDDDEMPSPRSRMRDLSPSRSGLSPSPSASPSPLSSIQRSSSPCTRRHRHGTGLRHRTHLSDVVAWHHLSFQYALAYGVAPDGLHLEPIAIYDKTFREPQWKTSSSWKEKIAVGILTKEGIHAKHIATSVRTAHSVVDLLSYIFNVKAHPGLETVLLAENFFSNPKHGFIFREGSERLQQEVRRTHTHIFQSALVQSSLFWGALFLTRDLVDVFTRLLCCLIVRALPNLFTSLILPGCTCKCTVRFANSLPNISRMSYAISSFKRRPVMRRSISRRWYD